MLDLVIRNGALIDGTGGSRVHGDLGVKNGRVVAMGDVDESAQRTIDAEGRAVTPGFVDVHTHLDAQLFWDPSASPSPLHGVTTAFAGNCGFTLAPLTPEVLPYLITMLSRVEGMPLESLQKGVPADWSTTAEYMDRLDGNIAINAGFMVGHSAIRRVVMGEAANQRASTPAELEAMKVFLRAGLQAGAMGFSTTTSNSHSDADGRPVPSRFADKHEFIELARVVSEFPGTSLELLPKGATDLGPFDDDVAALLIEMSVAGKRPVNWNVIQPTANTIDTWRQKLAVADEAAKRGGKVVGLVMPIDMKARFSFHAGFVLDMFDGWAPIMALPVAEKIAVLRDKNMRHDLQMSAEGTRTMRHLSKWAELVIVETFAPQNENYRGRKLGVIAPEMGMEPFDALVEIALVDELRTTFCRDTGTTSDADWAARMEIVRDKRALVGASDTGAHLDMIAAFRYSTGFIQEAVRERSLLTLEEAVYHMTSAAAELYGLHDRGRLAVGARADILVMDEHNIGTETIGTRFDLPGGAGRLYAGATGIDHVFVNGTEVAQGGEYTGHLPGRVLRAGVDTQTPSMALRGG